MSDISVIVSRLLIAPFARRLLARSQSFEPRVIVMMDGGLGSQMWQYALGLAAGASCGLPVLYDLAFYREAGMDIAGIESRAYRLDAAFGISAPEADADTVSLYKKYFHFKIRSKAGRYRFREDALASREARYLDGYYVNARYIEPVISRLDRVFTFRQKLTPESERIMAEIRAAETPVAIHIRRGDFVGSRHCVTSAGYFRAATERAASALAPAAPVFFVFSNGMDWAREALAGLPYDIRYAEANGNDDGSLDMRLMTECSHFIISNSSFSWWAACLSSRAENKLVIMPDRWHEDEPPDAAGSMRLADWETMPTNG